MIAITNDEFIKLTSYIKANYGIQLKEEKKALVTSRLQNVLTDMHFKNFTEYYNYIINDKTGKAAITLMNKITTNHTYFMRESEHFDFLKATVLPYLRDTVSSRDLRIWSAGCSSGEEPYTLAMILDEFFGKDKMLWDSKILATDISNHALETAQAGIYSNTAIAPLPPMWKNNYFQKYDEESRAVTNAIKNEVIFRKFNLMTQQFSFKKKFHVIFCRNVMIYFDSDTRDELVNRFYDATEVGGYLFVGHSESLNRETTRYKYIKPAVYRKE